MKYAHTYDPAKGAAGPWLRSIAINCARAFLRERQRSDGGMISDEYADKNAAIADCVAIPMALAELSEEHRVVFLMREVAGYSVDETARVLGIPSGTVKSRLSRAMERMRESLE